MTSKWRLMNTVRSLRFKLIGWYVLLLLVSLVVFSVYIFFQYRGLQQTQQDNLLDAYADKLRGQIETRNTTEPYLRALPGPGGDASGFMQDLNRQNLQVHVYNASGKLVFSLGSASDLMPTADPLTTGIKFVTLNTATDGQWRIYNSPLLGGRDGQQGGWLEVGQSVNLLNADLNRLVIPLLFGTLIALTLAILGGLFLANQALRPIDRVTRTVQSITAQDLSRRINYHGPADEIGRLAKTLDKMLDRLEGGFEQERRFTADASHEMRTPLTALKGRIEVTLSRDRTEEQYRETLTDLSSGVDRLIGLTNSLLYLARLDQPDQPWQSEVLNLSDVLDSLQESMQPVAELKQIEFTGNLSTSAQVQGNLDQLTRLFLNLLGNAIKYTPEGGHIEFQLQKLEKEKLAVVSISDNGPGIAPEHLPHLFERFYRVESDRASTTGGTGLGLAIAHEIARQHSGILEIESQPGKGTRAIVKLPLAESLVQGAA